jgi:signal transduction histidine kinase
VSLAALALLCLVVSGGVAWVAALLQSTSATLMRNSESLRLATQIEFQLLNYSRLATLPDDEQTDRNQRDVAAALQRSLESIVALSESEAEAALINRAVRDVNVYLSRRAEIDRRANRETDTRLEARPFLDDALDSLTLLVNTDEREVAAAYARAQRIGSFFIAAAIATVLLTGALLVIMTFAMRRMLLRPILGLRDTIDRFRAGDPGARADERAPRELAEIGRTFNEMSEDLSRQKARELAFIAGVAHDLRNPLAALQFSLDAMRARRSTWDPDTARIFEILGRQLDHVSRMVTDLLETCYIEAGQLTLNRVTFDLRDAARSVVDLYRPVASDRPIEVDLGEAPSPVHADRTRVEQVIGNLVSNSIKYSPAGSRICLGVTHGDGDVELYVSDEGVGIKKEDRENIFRPFWRADEGAKRSGTGLGLSVVRKIVAAHGGTISVESTPGKRSVFGVRFPLASVRQPAQASA